MSTYVYGVVESNHPLVLDDRTGLGDPPRALRRVGAGGLAAVVSDAPDGMRGKRRDLLAHTRVLDDLCAAGSVLPMRFGYVAADDDTVAEHLRDHEAEYARCLSAVAGCVEFNIKAGHHEDEVLRELLTSSPRLRDHNEELARAGGGYEQRLRFGELVSQALRERERSDSEAIERCLRTHAVTSYGGTAAQNGFFNVSFLVDRAELDAFTHEVERLNEHGTLELTAHGPLPPYSFTATPAE